MLDEAPRRRPRRQGERRRRLRRAARSARCSTCAARTRCRIFWDVDAPATLDRDARATRRSVPRAACPRYDLVLTYGGGDAGRRRLPRASARARCVPIYNALDPDDAPPGRRRPALRRRPRASSATACPTARRASRSSSCAPPRALPERRFLLGGNGWDDKPMPANVALPRPRLHARPQRLQLHAAGGAQHQPRQHGALRLLAGDPRLRGGRRRRLPDHRRLGGHRAVPRARRAKCWSRATATRSPSTSPRSTPARARAIGERGARAACCAEHTYAHRGAAGRGAARRRGAASAAAHELRR